MGCGGCGGGHDPYAAYRRRGVRMSRGSTQGVIKSQKRLAREARGEELKIDASKEEVTQKLPDEVPPSGVIKMNKSSTKKAEKPAAKKVVKAKKNKAAK